MVLTFDSVNFTMQVEKKLLQEGYAIKTIPTPREIHKSCGLSIMMGMEHEQEMIQKKSEGWRIGYIWKYSTEKDHRYAELING